MQFIISACKANKDLRKFAEKLENGLEHWFTCLLHPEIDMTSNKAERALRGLNTHSMLRETPRS